MTGASSGIGAATALALAHGGYTVWGLSRRGTGPQMIRPISADVTDADGVKAAIAGIIAVSGRLDLVVNCAGSGISGAVEFTAPAESELQMAVNLSGTANVCREAIPHLRETRGMILNITSVAGALAIPFQTWYSVSKAALNAYSAALANELRPFGIRVCAVMPGDIKTGFTAARQKSPAGDEIYCGRISRSVSKMEHDEQTGMPPEAVAKKIVRLAGRKKLPPCVTVGFGYSALVILARLLPQRLVNRVLFEMYAK